MIILSGGSVTRCRLYSYRIMMTTRQKYLIRIVHPSLSQSPWSCFRFSAQSSPRHIWGMNSAAETSVATVTSSHFCPSVTKHPHKPTLQIVCIHVCGVSQICAVSPPRVIPTSSLSQIRNISDCTSFFLFISVAFSIHSNSNKYKWPGWTCNLEVTPRSTTTLPLLSLTCLSC